MRKSFEYGKNLVGNAMEPWVMHFEVYSAHLVRLEGEDFSKTLHESIWFKSGHHHIRVRANSCLVS